MRGGGKPLQVVIGGGSYGELARWRDQIIAKIEAENPRILNLDSDYQERKPQLSVKIDRNRAADLGVSLQNVGRTLETMLGSRIVTTFMRDGEEYNVVLQAREEDRATVSDLGNLYVKSETFGRDGAAVGPGHGRGIGGLEPAEALRPAALDHDHRQPRAGLHAGRGACPTSRT